MESELNIWYFDNCTLGGDTLTIVADIKKAMTMGEEYGLTLNMDKCEVLCQTTYNEEKNTSWHQLPGEFPAIKLISQKDWCILGSLATDEAIEGSVLKKVEEVKRMTGRLGVIESHQAMYHAFAQPEPRQSFVYSENIASLCKASNPERVRLCNLM